MRIGARRDGTLAAKEVDCWVDTGAYADCGPGVATKMGYAGVGPYRIPHVRVDSLAIYTNLPPNGAFRGYGAMQSVWASERTMDLLARELEMSPLELRRMNLLRDGDEFATGEVVRDVHFEECLQAADAVDYEADPRGKGLCVLLKECRRRAAPRSPSSARRSATWFAAPHARWDRACGGHCS